MAMFEEQVKRLDFRGIMISAIITAMAFVVGLFWRDAITETIKIVAPQGTGLVYSYITAVIATVIVVIMAYVLMKTQTIKIESMLKKRRPETKEEKKEKQTKKKK